MNVDQYLNNNANSEFKAIPSSVSLSVSFLINLSLSDISSVHLF